MEYKSFISDTIAQLGEEPNKLIPLLQQVQEKYGFIPEETVDIIAQNLNLSANRIYGVMTFYAQFKLKPCGKHLIRVCEGTACHIKGAEGVYESISGKLGIHEGETTADDNFTLERVPCVGCCHSAPIVVVDSDYHGNTSANMAKGILENYK
ncbi:MAG: NADH-quinone oxidoreductase subunit NuoE [Candidatus Schekmanbacteria bacterium]|nr:NADH-quinone oxidoreductase subunit NuoE [Candidatus Schekmanbacteria bacterium]